MRERGVVIFLKNMQPKKLRITILGFLLAWLLAGLSLAAAGETLLYEEWLGVYFQNKKFGFAHSRGWEIKEKGKIAYRLEGESLIKIKIADQMQETFLKETAWLDDKMELQRVNFRQRINDAPVEIRAVRTAGGFALTIKSSEEERREELKASRGVLTSAAAGFVMLKRGMEPGKTYRLEIFLEPLLLVVPIDIKVKGIETVKFEGQDVEAYVLEEKYAEFSSTTWVAVKTGETLKEISPQGLTSKRESKAEALSFDLDKVLGLEELFAWSLVPVKQPINDPQKLRALTVRVSRVPQKDFFLTDERQSWSQVSSRGGGWEALLNIKVKDIKESEGSSLKEAGRGQEEYLKSDAFAQSDHPEVIKLAREIVKGETNAYRAAQKINRWVYKNIDKKYQDSFSALDTLKSRQGECQAHSQLFAALARAQGIPTRMAYGLVYLSSWGGFLYHQWPEVWVGRWVALDPTLGQETADATHIKLAQGGQEAAVKIVGLIGKIGLTVVSSQ